jgi:hypothetical protein
MALYLKRGEKSKGLSSEGETLHKDYPNKSILYASRKVWP